MKSTLAHKPSPAVVVSVIALVFAVSGIAIAAGPGGMFSKAETKKVKKLARAEASKMIGKRAAQLSVASAANAAALGGQPPSAYAQAASEAYRVIGAPGQPQFENGWINYGSQAATAAFFKDPLGVVHLRGRISSSAGGTTAFILPPGYRPAAFLTFPAVDIEGLASVSIGATGIVRGGCPKVACNPGLDGITFRAEQ